MGRSRGRGHHGKRKGEEGKEGVLGLVSSSAPHLPERGRSVPLGFSHPPASVPAGNRSAIGTEFSALIPSLLWSQSVQELVSLKRTRASTEVRVGGRGLVAHLG